MILGVGRIDGDQRQRRASPRGRPCRRLGRFGLGDHRRRERYAECRARGWRSSRPPSRWSASPATDRDLAARQAVAAGARRLDLDEVAVAWRRRGIPARRSVPAAGARPARSATCRRARRERRRERRPCASRISSDPRGVGRAVASSVGKTLASTRSPMPGAGPLPPRDSRIDNQRRLFRLVACTFGRPRQKPAIRHRARKCRARRHGAGRRAGSAACGSFSSRPSSCRSRSSVLQPDAVRRPSARTPWRCRACPSGRDFPRRSAGDRRAVGRLPFGQCRRVSPDRLPPLVFRPEIRLAKSV